jgi:hypothetical protein
VIPKPPVTQWRKINKPTALQLKLLGSKAKSAPIWIEAIKIMVTQSKRRFFEVAIVMQ